MAKKFIVSASPHITAGNSTDKIMRDVCIALLPALIASVVVFGFYPLVVAIVSIGTALATESIWNLLRKKPNTINDWSAVVTGLLLGLNLPPVVPLYVPVIGSIFAIAVVKMLFGGIGKNFANPAITARIFLLLAWAGVMATYVAPVDYGKGAAEALFGYFKVGIGSGDIAAVSSATPLGIINDGGVVGKEIWLKMFLGNVGGSAGETSVLALLIGGIYLIVRRVINWRIPAIYIGTVAVFTLIFAGAGLYDMNNVLPLIFGGGLFLGAFFMATDYSTSPNTQIGICVYAFGCGFLTVMIRYFGVFPEGVSFAILLMNLVTPLLDKYIRRKPFGYVKPPKKKKEGTV